jgi:2,4-dienoyl-CoA reductase-like NADH-dependent reductase (Old Yellow Enzyme family)
MKTLFSSIKIREKTFENRIFVSPMCQYSSANGLVGDWHLVHLGTRAVGGAALVMVEATAVSPEGRISPRDSGIWSDEHSEAFKRITAFIKEQGAVPAIQLAHAGRKASTDAPWRGDKPLGEAAGGWEPVAPSAIPFGPGSPLPRSLEPHEIERLVTQFVDAAKRSLSAGFEVLELHMAHGYLLHEFLSPISNQRRDRFGGSLENRVRFPLKVARAARAVWPEHLPLLVRISCTDWVEGGWDLDQSIKFCEMLKGEGVDLIDCSSGAMVPDAVIPAGPGFQVPFAASIRKEVGIATGAVGFITSPAQAEQITATGQADVVLLAREMLRNPYWPLQAAQSLGVEVPWPKQYERAKSG